MRLQLSYAREMSIDLGELYAASRYRITDLMMSSQSEVDRPCPATPAWTVREVVCHVRGVTEDVRLGNVAGAATDPWTADQVRRHRGTDITTLLDDWADDAPMLEALLSSPHGAAAARAVIDVNAHEADVRGALDHVVELPDPFGEWAMETFSSHINDSMVAAGLAPIRIETSQGDVLGSADADVVLKVGRYELFRALLGRRSPAQVLAYDWGGADGTPYLEQFFVFGPRETDLIEVPVPSGHG